MFKSDVVIIENTDKPQYILDKIIAVYNEEAHGFQIGGKALELGVDHVPLILGLP